MEARNDRGQRAWSKIVIELDVAHDGNPQVVADRLAVEVDAVINRATGIDVMDGPIATGTVREAGDAFSPQLPAWL